MIGTGYLIVLVLTGLLVGTLSGMLGVGGGFLMVPIQLWLYSSTGLPEDLALRLALGTSLAVIIPTAASGAIGHHRKGAVVWRAGFLLGVSGAFGAVAGGLLATHLPAEPVEIFFGLIVLAAGIRTIATRGSERWDVPKIPDRRYLIWGVPVGVVSGLAGIGGGVLLIPVLTSVFRFEMHRAVATSTVVMICAATGGVLTYLIGGLGIPGLPEWTIGYIDPLQAFIIAATSIPAAQAGSVIAHRIPSRVLRIGFLLLTGYIGLRMIGVFSWAGITP
ncbi:sulfite exporter TauE/SafE family protein [Methanofollis fontis]|uniref:Probable membrane transporter protein n=1 Tax=Methanofollis fontis TaxID=2052832 RepID=A0A483CUG3_9EURY|nr:sulfite exporter TauE/SafE family protein [Methanofollis fontis]TAJ44537.1 sulfite exporter TauE/SafE family protein [Methanofollis fontis]